MTHIMIRHIAALKTKEELLSWLKSLKETETERAQALLSTRNEIDKTTLKLIQIIHGVTVGTEVKYQGKPYKVSQVDTRWGYERPWLVGYPKKKDGTWGTAGRNLCSCWEI